jgi:hypothetical protein
LPYISSDNLLINPSEQFGKCVMSDDPTEIKPAWPSYNPYEPVNPYYGDTPTPPPPPSYKKRRHVVLVVSVLVAMLLVAATVGSLLVVKLNQSVSSHAPTSTHSPFPTSSQTVHPTAPPVNGQSDLYSQNFTSFYGAFSQAMTTGQYDLGSTVSQAFKLSCDPSPNPPCTYDWLNTHQMLTERHLGFSFPYNATYTNDSCNNIAYPVRAFTYTVVQYTQDGIIKVPTSGDAVMIFSLSYISENTSQWHWEGVILQSSC